MPLSIPLPLKAALEAGDCVLFVGAGVGSHVLGADGKPLPNGSELALEMCEHYGIASTSADLPKVSKVVELRKGRPELDSFVRKRLSSAMPDKDFQWLSTIRWRAIFTTNYDYAIPKAYELNPTPPQKVVPISAAAELIEIDPRFDVPVYYLHGSLFGGLTKILITSDDYATFSSKKRMLFERLKQSFATSAFLYIGYSNRDPNWQTVLSEVAEEFLPKKMPQSYRIDPYADDLDIEILREKNIETLKMGYADFVAQAISELKDFKLEHDTFRQLQGKIPLDLIESFHKNPVATSRLVTSWQYVNQADYSSKYSIDEFLKGDRATWSLIAKKDFFERDVYDEVFNVMLDYATSSSKGPKCAAILAPAGYGNTTLLMSLAVGLVAEGVTIYYLKPGAGLKEGDIEFAVRQSTLPPFFLIDDAAEHLPDIADCMNRLREAKLTAFFLLAERRNEWASSRHKMTAKLFDIQPLSEQEIARLLDYLERHHALNKLTGLERSIQQSEIRNRSGKELLVAMREATEGTGFDAIVEDEYRSIQDDNLQNLYLTICCMHQFGAPLRDGALATALGTDIPALYSLIGGRLDGVVHFDLIDEANGTYAARSRHRVIAQIVWERCGESGAKDDALIATLKSLNLSFRADSVAFDHLIRSDRIVDGIRSLDQRIRFFESACRKDPENPYIRQHFARMLLRAGELASALAQINEGVSMNEGRVPKVLFHTQGVILTEVAVQSESVEIGRRQMLKAEQSFGKLVAANERDDFAYQGLASLYLKWAQKIQNESESASYIAKAEEQISIGLKLCRSKDSLWIASSEVEAFVGNQPSRLKALENAVRDSPASVVARYLLARCYRANGKYSEAIDTLQPVIESHPDEYRSFLEYALALFESGKDLQKAASILGLSTLYGYGDIRYLATHAGILFLAGKATEYEQVYREVDRRDFSGGELRKIYFTPRINGDPITKTGRVVSVRGSTAQVEVDGFAPISLSSSKVKGEPLLKGYQLSFELAFTGYSVQAIKPKIVEKLPTHPQTEF